MESKLMLCKSLHAQGSQSIKKSTAFTLIELLVVVAIIAVLVALLLPALQRAREGAGLASCGAHEHQIGIALSMYTQAFNDTLPNSDDNGQWYNWSFKLIQTGLIQAEGPNYKGWPIYNGAPNHDTFKGIMSARPGEMKTVFNCPRLSLQDLAGTGYDDYVNAYGSPQGVMGDFLWPDWEPHPRFSRLAMFPRLDYTIAVYDGTDMAEGSNGIAKWGAKPVGPIWGCAMWGQPDRFVSTRHFGKSNCLFLDGHISLVSVEEISNNRELFPDRDWNLYSH
jgi:prepilin-type N-terminal cleavage/methylation domain-containing protein/prepilin-type processing-associated H-X9-DG protein